MNSIIKYLEIKSIFNQRIMVARSLLAFGALLTLICNNPSEMTNESLLDISNTSTPIFKKYSLFSLFDNSTAQIMSILFLLVVITGYVPKITAILQSWVHLSICNSFIIIDGGDQIASNLSLLLIPICTFDGRINQWKDEKRNDSEYKKIINVFFNIYFFLISIQVAVIYLHAGIGKLYTVDWQNGTATYYWFTHNVFGAPILLQKMYNLITLSVFSPIIAWLVIILEIGLFACILATNRRLKMVFLIIGLFFHFSICFNHGLISFFFSMAGALILYLDSNNEIYNFFNSKTYNYVRQS